MTEAELGALLRMKNRAMALVDKLASAKDTAEALRLTHELVLQSARVLAAEAEGVIAEVLLAKGDKERAAINLASRASLLRSAGDEGMGRAVAEQAMKATKNKALRADIAETFGLEV